DTPALPASPHRRPSALGTARLVGRSARLRKPLPFGPVVDALAGAPHLLPTPAELSPVTAALRPLLPELADRLPPPLDPAGNRRQDRKSTRLNSSHVQIS